MNFPVTVHTQYSIINKMIILILLLQSCYKVRIRYGYTPLESKYIVAAKITPFLVGVKQVLTPIGRRTSLIITEMPKPTEIPKNAFFFFFF